MRLRILFALPFALACGGPSEDAAEASTGAEATPVGASEPGPMPPHLPAAMEAGVTELFRLANGARFMEGKAMQEQCDDCWPPEVELFHTGLAPADLEPSNLAETLGELTAALEPVRPQAPFGTLAAALESHRQALLARAEPFEPSEVLTQATAALGSIRAAITAEAAMAPTEPALCSAAVRLGSGQLQLWELELTRAAGAAEKAGDEAEGMRVLGIIELTREPYEHLSVALRAGPETAVPAIRAKLIFLRSLDSVFDRGDDEALLQATATLCEPLSTPAAI